MGNINKKQAISIQTINTDEMTLTYDIPIDNIAKFNKRHIKRQIFRQGHCIYTCNVCKGCHYVKCNICASR